MLIKFKNFDLNQKFLRLSESVKHVFKKCEEYQEYKLILGLIIFKSMPTLQCLNLHLLDWKLSGYTTRENTVPCWLEKNLKQWLVQNCHKNVSCWHQDTVLVFLLTPHNNLTNRDNSYGFLQFYTGIKV